MTDKTTERLISALLLLGMGSGGIGAYVSKSSGPTASEVISEIKDEARDHEFDIEKQQWVQDSRITVLERNGLVQKKVLDEILEEVKE